MTLSPPHHHPAEPAAAAPPVARSTRQRDAICVAIESAGRPLLPQEVLDSARAQVPGLGLATVYRNLKVLQEDGRVEVVVLPGQAPRFQAAEHEHHHHFHCERCDRVFPIHACPGPMDHLVPAGFALRRHDLTLHGLCADCVQAEGVPA
ncbi:MAG: Fur family transcriptional regulator [Leptothrix sp. (in: b-proteobacteria)]